MTRAPIRSTWPDQREARIRPLAPPGKRKSATIARSTSGPCSLARADTTVGSPGPSIRMQLIA